MKKALVFYLYGTKNAGDMAICIGTIEVLRKLNYRITMVSRFSESEDEYEISKSYVNSYFPDVKVVPGPFSFERDFGAIKKAAAYGKSFAKVCGIIPDSGTKALIDEADVVFFNGGNLLRGESVKDYARLVALFYPIQLAQKAGKPIYCLPQSTAGISRIGKLLLGKYMRSFTKIYIREKKSLEQLRRVFPDIRFEYCTDMAFFCADTEKAQQEAHNKYRKRSPKANVALILRNTGIGDIGNVDSDTEMKLLSAMRKYVENHPEKEYWIVVQTMKDREISDTFAKLISNKCQVNIVEDHDPLTLRELYKQMEFVITMRLHAGILALSTHIPVIGLFCSNWGLKNPGMMETFEMPYLMVDQRDGEIADSVERIPEDAPVRIADQIDSFRDTLVFD